MTTSTKTHTAAQALRPWRARRRACCCWQAARPVRAMAATGAPPAMHARARTPAAGALRPPCIRNILGCFFLFLFYGFVSLRLAFSFLPCVPFSSFFPSLVLYLFLSLFCFIATAKTRHEQMPIYLLAFCLPAFVLCFLSPFLSSSSPPPHLFSLSHVLSSFFFF